MATQVPLPILTTRALCEHGYFPKESPPTFLTVDFAKAVENAGPAVPPAEVTSAASFNLARLGRLRRKLSVPHPGNFARTSEEIANNYSRLLQQIQVSSLVRSAPVPDPKNKRALTPAVRGRTLVKDRLHLRDEARYLVRLDVASFYPSIYTHTIPWILETKAIAKRNRRDTTLLGNRLDKLLQNAQDGQTRGIPISPDTSFVIGELVLSAIDQDLLNTLDAAQIRSGMRFFDDYEFGCTSRDAASKVISAVDLACRSFELELNPRKIQVVELPHGIRRRWNDAIRQRCSRCRTEDDVIRLYDCAVRIAKRFPEESVFKYMIKCMSRVPLKKGARALWQIVRSQLCILEPSTLTVAIPQMFAEKAEIDAERCKRIVYRILSDHAELRHTSEVTWALWGCRLFGISLQEELAKTVAKNADCFSSIMLMDLIDQQQVEGDAAGVRDQMIANLDVLSADDAKSVLKSDRWLLAYESVRRGWVKQNSELISAANHDPWFDLLLKAGVSFFDGLKTPHVPAKPRPIERDDEDDIDEDDIDETLEGSSEEDEDDEDDDEEDEGDDDDDQDGDAGGSRHDDDDDLPWG